MTKAYTVEERAEQLRPYLEQGYTTREAAGVIGLSYSRANRVVAAARARGILPRRQIDIFNDIRVGPLGYLVRAQSEDFQYWLRGQIPDGGNISEFAVSCLLDVYFEENP